MISVYFSWRDWGSMATILAFCLVPIVAATILSFRSRRRGWWLALPGGLFAILAPPMVWLFLSVRAVGGDGGPAFLISMAMVVAAWIALGLFLTLLAVRGPKLPTLDLGEIF